MRAIIRNNRSGPKLIELKNLAISSTIPGVIIEVDNYLDMFMELEKEGFKPVLEGKLIHFEATGVTCFD